MTLLSLFESFVLAGWSCMALYGFLLSLVSWLTRRREAPLIFPRHVFALLIPVDKDEGDVADTLEHLRQLKYPRGMFDVILAPVSDTEQMATIARQKGVVVHSPGKRRWRDREEALTASLERLTAKSRYDAFVMLDAAVRLSPDYLSVLSDKLSKGALIIQSGYRMAGSGSFWTTGSLSILSALSPSWLTGWSGCLRLDGGLRHVGVCLSRRGAEKYGVRDPAITDPEEYALRLLRDDTVATFTPKAILYDHRVAPRPSKPARERISSWRRRMREHAIPLIREGIAWRSAAQTLGGINLILPSFSWMFAGALAFSGLALSAHGAGSPIVYGWLAVVAALILVVMVRLTHTGASVAACMALPALPFLMLRQSRQSRIPASETITAPVPAAEKASSQRNGSTRRRFSPRRNQRQMPSFGKGDVSDPA